MKGKSLSRRVVWIIKHWFTIPVLMFTFAGRIEFLYGIFLFGLLSVACIVMDVILAWIEVKK